MFGAENRAKTRELQQAVIFCFCTEIRGESRAKSRQSWGFVSGEFRSCCAAEIVPGELDPAG